MMNESKTALYSINSGKLYKQKMKELNERYYKEKKELEEKYEKERQALQLEECIRILKLQSLKDK